MELGTGIFLSAIFLGTVALYIATKDRWNWKKIFLWPLIAVAGLWGVAVAVSYSYKQYEERPKVLTEFKGVQLGEKLQDVIFKHGKVEREATRDAETLAKHIVEHANEKGTPKFDAVSAAYKRAKEAEAEAIAKGTDGNYWINDVGVSIKNNQVERVIHQCLTDSKDYTTVNGIGCGSTGEEVLTKFGSDVRVQCGIDKRKDGDLNLTRAYDVVKYGTRYFLTKNEVIAVLVASPATIDSYVGSSWGKCN